MFTATLNEPYKGGPRSRFTPSEAASQLFGPHLYPLYINWQRDIGHPNQASQYSSIAEWQWVQDAVRSEEVGGVPSPEVYKVFMFSEEVRETVYLSDGDTEEEGEEEEEEEEEGAGGDILEDGSAGDGGRSHKGSTGLITAQLCRHKLHPGNPCTEVKVCPECVIRECIASLDRISSVWRSLGGPCKPARSDGEMSPEEHSRISLYYALRRLWHAEKTRWANLVHRFAGYAEWEATWEGQSEQVGFAVPEAVRGASSCTEALEMAWQSPLLVEGWDEIFVPGTLVEESDTGTEVEGHWLGNECPVELPYSPPASPKETKNALPAEAYSQSDGPCEKDRNQPDNQGSFTRPEESATSSTVSMTAFRPPSPSASPKNVTSSSLPIHAPSSPPLASSPPILMSPPVPRGVTFPEDLPDALSRSAQSYRRGSSSYQQGRHASPSGTEWADTSFLYDPWYEVFGADEDEDEKMDQLERARDSASGADGLGGFTNEDIHCEDDDESDDESEDEAEEEGIFEDDHFSDIVPEIPCVTGKRKRLGPREVERSRKGRPIFRLRWRRSSSPESVGEEEKVTVADPLVGSQKNASLSRSRDEDVGEDIVS